jgi:hypothetical protein
MNLSHFKFRSGNQDRVTDNRAQFALRWQDHQSPRQRRLHAERRFLLAQYHSVIADILGVIVLAIIIITLFYLA